MRIYTEKTSDYVSYLYLSVADQKFKSNSVIIVEEPKCVRVHCTADVRVSEAATLHQCVSESMRNVGKPIVIDLLTEQLDEADFKTGYAHVQDLATKLFGWVKP